MWRWLILFGLFSSPCWAGYWSMSQYDARHWTVNEGLPQISVYDITQDSQQYIWLATERGIVRFDGQRFRTFDKDDSPFLENSLIKQLLWTQDQQLLLRSSTHLLVMRDTNFANIDVSQTESKRVEDFITLPNGQVIVAAGGLYRLDDQQLVELESPLLQVQKLAVIDSELCAVAVGGLWCQQNGQFVLIADGLAGLGQVTVIQRYFGKTYLGTSKGLYVLQDGQWQRESLSAAYPQELIHFAIAQDTENFWVGSDNGVYRFYRGRLVEAMNYQHASPLLRLRVGFIDSQQQLWFGSQTEGLYRMQLNPASMFGAEAGLTNPFTWAIGELQSGMLVGTNQGLFLRLPGRAFTPVILDKELDNKAYYSFWFDEENEQLWLGSKAGLALYQWPEQRLLTLFHEFDSSQINGIVPAPEGVWIATSHGLWRYLQGKMQSIDALNNNQYGGVRTVLNVDQQLWIGTEHGLLVQHQDILAPVLEPTLAKAFISYLGLMDDGTLAVGTFQHGLWLKQASGWLQLSKPQGLPIDNITHVTDTGSALLLAGLQGVVSVDRQTINQPFPHFQVVVDNTGDRTGFERFRCCNGAGVDKGWSDRSRTYLPTVNGVLVIEHALLREAQPVTKPIFEGLQVGDKWLQPPLVLEPELRDWTVHFSSPYFQRTADLEYRYQMQGYDQDWKIKHDQNPIAYTNLKAGDYRFVVQARQRGFPQWSDSLVVPIAKKPFWYESIWFYGVVLIALTLLMRAVWWLRSRTLLERQFELEQEVAKRTDELNHANQLLQQANEQLLQASLRDPMTGLHNRRYLSQTLPKLLANASRRKEPLGVLLIDLDDFKKVNDQHGHGVGDEVLIIMAEILIKQCRLSDHLVRWGGEEFVVVVEQSQGLVELAERILSAVAHAPWPAQLQMTCSVGLSCHPVSTPASWPFDSTIMLADKAMYLVKHHGKNGWYWLQLQTAPDDATAQLLHLATPEQLINHPYIHVRSSFDRRSAPITL